MCFDLEDLNKFKEINDLVFDSNTDFKFVSFDIGDSMNIIDMIITKFENEFKVSQYNHETGDLSVDTYHYNNQMDLEYDLDTQYRSTYELHNIVLNVLIIPSVYHLNKPENDSLQSRKDMIDQILTDKFGTHETNYQNTNDDTYSVISIIHGIKCNINFKFDK